MECQQESFFHATVNPLIVVVDANLAFKALVTNRGDLRDRLWTEDRELKAGLRAHGFNQFFGEV